MNPVPLFLHGFTAGGSLPTDQGGGAGPGCEGLSFVLLGIQLRRKNESQRNVKVYS